MLNNSNFTEPFSINDIVEFFIPKIKININIPGELGKILDFSEQYIINNLQNEAEALRLLLKTKFHEKLDNSGNSTQ